MFDFVIPHWDAGVGHNREPWSVFPHKLGTWHLLTTQGAILASDWSVLVNTGSDWPRGVRRRNVSITREMQMRISWEPESHSRLVSSQVTSHY